MRTVAVVLSAWGASGLRSPAARRTFAQRNVVVRSTDITGTKFEEEDETKNPQKRPGHQVRGMAEIDPETAAKMAVVRAHQEGCPRLSWAEEIRTIVAQSDGFATLSTIAKAGSAIEGFPSGSVVGFAVDAVGRPIFCFSGMSGHTQNLKTDGRASLCVTEQAFEGAADARAVLTGSVVKIEDKAEDAAAREAYLASHPGAFWANFGDFGMYRMDAILDISFVGGFARAGGVTPEEYMAAAIDPLVAFGPGVMSHMNDDHEESLKSYVVDLVGASTVKSAQMKRLDRFGFDVRVVDEATGSKGVLRVPFVEPVTDRKGIKDAIVKLSKQIAAAKKAAE